MSTQFYIPPWHPTLPYAKYDIFYDAYQGSNLVYGYATQANAAQNPNAFYYFGVTAYSRMNDITTLSFASTGGVPNFQPGSNIVVTGMATNTTTNYSGMVINGGPGWVQYLNPGWSQTDNAVTTGAINCFSPCWTSGFLFLPSYSTKVDSNNKAIVAKLGDSFEQRMPQSLNTYDKTWNMVFATRSDLETKAIINYVQDSAGVRAFPIVIPVSRLENQPNQKYVADSVSYTEDSFNTNTITATVRRVFDL